MSNFNLELQKKTENFVVGQAVFNCLETSEKAKKLTKILHRIAF